MIQTQRLCLRLGPSWTFQGWVNNADGITRKPSQSFLRAWNRAGFSSIPVHLPTCSLWWHQQLRCTVCSLCAPVWWVLTTPQSWTHQRKSKRGGQSNCKRPSYINGAKALCFIWTCLGLFVCTPHSFTLDEMQSRVFPPGLSGHTVHLVAAQNSFFAALNPSAFCFAVNLPTIVSPDTSSSSFY